MPATPDDVIEAIKKAIKIIKEIIPDLNALFEEMASYETKRNVAKSVGTTVNCVGATAAVASAFFTGGLSLIALLAISAVGSGTNVVTHFVDNSETKDCIKKIESMLEKLNEQMKKLQSLIEEFNEQVEEVMRTQNIDRDRATFLLFGCPVDVDDKIFSWLDSKHFSGPPLTSMAVLAGCLQVLKDKTMLFLLDDVALGVINSGKSAAMGGAKAGADGVGKMIGQGVAVTGVLFAAWEAYDLVQTLENDHPCLKAIKRVRNELSQVESQLNTNLNELQKNLTAARSATSDVITRFLNFCLGGGYRLSSTTVFPLTFSEFIDQIGRGTKGGIYHLIFMAEMQGRTIEIFDRTSDRSFRRQCGTDHHKIDPFVLLSRDPIRIEIIGEEGAHHYRPVRADGTAVEVAANSPYANRCLFDAIAYQLGLQTDPFITSFKDYLRKNSMAQEVHELNIQEIFPEFEGGAKKLQPDAPKRTPVKVKRGARKGNQVLVAATVRKENLYQGSTPNGNAIKKRKNNGIPNWDHAGHIIANLLGGEGDVDNIEPMQGTLNVGQYRTYESNIRNVLEDPRHAGWRAEITVIITYDSDPNSSYPDRPTNFGYRVEFYDAKGRLLEKHEMDWKNYPKPEEKKPKN